MTVAMTHTALIGGTGFDRLVGFEVARREAVKTPYGEPSGPLLFGRLGEREWVFLPRHGAGHTIAPHQINYRANIRALKDTGVTRVIGLAAVGGIAAGLTPGRVVLPEQIIDYTWGRAHTFFDSPDAAVKHIEFSMPYSAPLRAEIIAAATTGGVELATEAVYAVTQGPRLETAAEIDRLERDGASIVGMTGMPEAALAREAGMDYATLAIVVNPAAGRGGDGGGGGEINMETIAENLEVGGAKVMEIITRL